MSKCTIRLQDVKESGFLLSRIPEKERTYELCLEAVKRTGQALQFVPKRFLTEEICWTAIKTNGWAIKYVPEEFRTYELCEEIINQRYLAFTYIPKEFKKEPKKSEKLLSKQEILEKYSIEELLTSDKPYLRKLGLSENKYLKNNKT
jgi:hypothetical protein